MHKQIHKQKKQRTPWGVEQTSMMIAPGLTSYTTASHGGFHLDRDNNAKVASCLKRSTFAGLGLKGWYEEDVDWAIVVYTFPEYFVSEKYQAAIQCLKDHHPDAWQEIHKGEHKIS